MCSIYLAYNIHRNSPSVSLREQIFKQSTELVCRAYGEVYKAVTNPTNAYKDAESVLHRSPQQVQTLLSWNVQNALQIVTSKDVIVYTLGVLGLATRCSCSRQVMGFSLRNNNYAKQRHSSDSERTETYLSGFLTRCSVDAAVCQRRGQDSSHRGKKYLFFLPTWTEIPTSRPGEANYRPFHRYTHIHMHSNISTVIALHTQGLFSFTATEAWCDSASVCNQKQFCLLFKSIFS